MNPTYRIQILRYEWVGAPAEVLAEVAVELPAPGPGEALVAMRCAAIHYSDLGLINGTYGKKRNLPAVAGREGVGEVVALGPGVAAPKIGARVRMPEAAGVWREAVVAKAEALEVMPAGVPVEQAAMAFINPPTAWRMLRDFVKLERGDWLIQNAGTSAVGVLVAQLARHFGFHCISVVREVAKAEAMLRAAGAEVVVAEESGYEKDIAKLTGGAPVKLALNAVGGESVGRLCRAVAAGGVVVTYGGVTAEPMKFPTRFLIFNDLRLRGFWLDQWVRQNPEEARKMMDEIFSLLRKGVLAQPVAARYPLAEWRAALEHAFRNGKGGKVMLAGEWKL
ncbi:MAG TPA: zinc-dependent alcohol dehydrogenase family protein [Opitutales bacterium]|jgi:trans-2-enoyl-CoA reductase|nr:zinc-dependent alcohol dehydrogenase family protein [Opitutales bacterium]